MAEDIVQWLEGHGLGKYAQAFAENRIDLDILPDLSEPDLEKLDIPLGDRKRLLRAIADLLDSTATVSGATLESAATTTSSSKAERRQLTVLFCDLFGSTELSTKLDPEDMRDVLLAYQEACSKVIARYEGFVAKFMGDGVYAYFGYPTAHEDDAERAINSGLAIVKAIEDLNAKHSALAVRIGVATGLVAVGDLIGEGASEEAAIVGEAPNLAARLQAIAEPNTVVVGELTHSLAGGMFESTDLGAQEFKGFSDPVGAWIVLRSRRTGSRFHATRGEHLTELIGREEELGSVLRRWQRSKAGEGQVVLISGEPGIGKSRLAQALQDEIVGQPHTLLRYQCSPYHTNSALHPVIEQFERVAGFEAGDSPDEKLDKLEAALTGSGRPVQDAAPLIASLLSIPTGDRYPAINVSPQRQKEMTLGALVDQLVGLSNQQPVLFVFEDAHWIDPTTLELLDMAVERAADLAMLMLITYRPEFAAPWVGRARVTPVILNRLDRRDCTLMVEIVAKDLRISEEIRDRIVAQTDGVPLFIEEVTKSVLETATGSTATIDVPATLKDSLEARLDRLGTAKEIAQIGAAIGRTFGYDLISRVATAEGSLRAALDSLVHSGLVTARGEPPEATYTFKHALVQDMAYESLMRRRRTEIHGQIAQALEAAEAVPEIIAFHLTEAGATERAVLRWQEAGRRALGHSAGAEAIAHLQRALELARTLPETQERAQLEFDLLMALSPAVIMTEGMASDEIGTLHKRAFELAEVTGDQNQSFRALFGSWMYHIQRPPLAPAQRVAARLVGIAAETRDTSHQLQAHHALWTPAFFLGDLSTAHHHLQEGSRLYDIHEHGDHANVYGGHDPGGCALNFNSMCLWLLGYPHQSILTGTKATALSEEVGHKVSIAIAFAYVSICNLFYGTTEVSRTNAIRALEITEEYGFALGAPFSVMKGLAEAAEEKGRPADPDLIQICRRPSPAGMEFLRPYKLSFLARLQAEAGRKDDAFALIQDALELVSPYESHWCEAEVHRQKGELLRLFDYDSAEVESCFKTALTFAQRQGARAWELRTATSFARLKRDRGKTVEARDLLAPVYDWFTEGFDTADLKDAKALLEELS